MAAAACKLAEHSISGAPVIDEQLHCVGVLSAMDFVKQQVLVCQEDRLPGNGGNRHSLRAEGRHQTLQVEEQGKALVCHHMSPAVQSIDADEPLLAAARMMCALHIHRLPVLDRRGHPTGMITAMDIVAALLNAIDESQHRLSPHD